MGEDGLELVSRNPQAPWLIAIMELELLTSP